jgi:HK97 family phage prohead protease
MKKRNATFKSSTIRSSDNDGKKFIEGIIPYDSKSVPIWGTIEIIDPTAFNKTLADKTEVRALYNHDDSKVLGSTKSGSLELTNTEDGLVCRCELPNTTYANDLFEVITRGDVRTMSFGFVPIKWEDSNNGKLRVLKEINLCEVSFGVAYSAFPETNSNTFIRKINMDLELLNEFLEKEELSEAELKKLKTIVETINGIIDKNSPKEEEAVKAENGEQREHGTPDTGDTSEKEKDKEELKKEIVGLIDMLFEVEKETDTETEETETDRTEEKQ